MPTDNTQPANFEPDGSLADAAMMMPDIDSDMDDPSPGQTRTEIIDPREAANRRGTPPQDNRQQSRQQRRQDDGKYADGFVAAPNLPPEADEQDDRADPAAVEAGSPDDEWFELPPEKEGEEPRRIKAEDVWKGYQEREQLVQHIEHLQRIVPPPVQYDEQIYETVKVRGKLLQELNVLIQANQPLEPDLSLIDDQSPRYNPGEYQRQVALQRDMAQRHHRLRERQAYEQHQLSQEQEALTAAKRVREQDKLVQFWPELRDPVVQRQVRDDAARYFGIDGGTLDSVMDARFYAILKTALAYVNGNKQRQQTVKVVRAKPKLVKGSARNTDSPRAAQFQSGMKALRNSQSEADAAQAIGGLI